MAASDGERQRSSPASGLPAPFGQLLKRLRTSADLTQEELAEQVVSVRVW